MQKTFTYCSPCGIKQIIVLSDHKYWMLVYFPLSLLLDTNSAVTPPRPEYAFHVLFGHWILMNYHQV